MDTKEIFMDNENEYFNYLLYMVRVI